MKRNISISIALIALAFIVISKSVMALPVDSIKSIKGLSVGYWGDVVNTYGVRVGMERYVLQTSKFKVIHSAAIGVQRRNDFYTSAGIEVGSALRRTYKSGLFVEYGLKLGYLGSYYDFDFYKVNSDDKIVNIGRKWKSSAICGYWLGAGYDFSRCSRFDIQFALKPGLYYRFPNFGNVFYLTNFGLEAGLAFHPKWFR